jgi:hypothetical protein
MEHTRTIGKADARENWELEAEARVIDTNTGREGWLVCSRITGTWSVEFDDNGGRLTLIDSDMELEPVR